MKYRIFVLVVTALILQFVNADAGIKQTWITKVGTGQNGGPCKKAKASVFVKDLENSTVGKIRVNLNPQYLGIGIHKHILHLPSAGMYSVNAELRHCDGTRKTTKSMYPLKKASSVFIKNIPNPRTISQSEK